MYSFGREVANVALRSLAVVVTVVLVIVSLNLLYQSGTAISDGSCNIAYLPIEGTILPFNGLVEAPLVVTPDLVESFLSEAEEELGIEAILIEINSPGGTPVASARIAESIGLSNLPVVGLIGDIAASGGYLVAAASDHLIASPMSDVGGIGVNMSYVEESRKNEEEGLTYVQLTSGEFKDAGSPNRPLTETEREKFQADLQLIHNEFVSLIAKYRNLEVDSVAALADGSSVPGVKALDLGLVDSLGGLTETKQILANLLEKSFDEIEICAYTPDLLNF